MTAPIQIFCERLAVERGGDYFTTMKALRHHLADIDDTTFLDELVRCDNTGVLGYLMAAGLSFARQDMLVVRLKQEI